MFKKVKVETPEVKIAGANLHVDAQKAQFTTMIEEVNYAIDQRTEAIDELDKEISSLEAQLNKKCIELEKAVDANSADRAYIERLQAFIG
jgi:SMC interacting uncharacterized protein involved in chromosome segregation